MAYLVTGGAGFIGSHLVNELVSKNKEVIVIDDLSAGKRKNIDEKAVFYEKNINDDLSEVFEKHDIEAVFHFAAKIMVQESIDNPLMTHDTNVNGTLNLLEHCRKHGVKRFVLSSSAAVYGSIEEMPLREDMKPEPISPYALHKFIDEEYCKLYMKLYGLEPVMFRYFNVYGPKQNPAGNYANLIPKFLKMLLERKIPTINGDGEQTRDFIYVKDVVRGNIKALNASDECFGEVFNLGTGISTSVNEVVSTIKEVTGSKVVPKHGPPVIEPRNSKADINKAKKLLDWKPEYSFKEGIKEMYVFTKNL